VKKDFFGFSCFSSSPIIQNAKNRFCCKIKRVWVHTISFHLSLYREIIKQAGGLPLTPEIKEGVP